MLIWLDQNWWKFPFFKNDSKIYEIWSKIHFLEFILHDQLETCSYPVFLKMNFWIWEYYSNLFWYGWTSIDKNCHSSTICQKSIKPAAKSILWEFIAKIWWRLSHAHKCQSNFPHMKIVFIFILIYSDQNW